MAELLSLAGTPKIWQVDGTAYIVYTIPDTEPPLRLAWVVPSAEDLEAIFGPDVTPTYNRTITAGQMAGMGVLVFGSTDELANFDDDPFATWTQTLATQALVQPWILDPDYQALIGMGLLEGRELTVAEIQGTEWWQSNTRAEREWMELYHGDPSEADRRLDGNRLLALEALRDAGMEKPSEALVNYMADQVTTGAWSVIYYNNQVKAISDPFSGHQVDGDLAAYLEGGEGETMGSQDTVERLIRRWLGPIHGDWTTDQVAEWAGTLRNDPDGETELVNTLKAQRLALFPEYEDDSLTYEDLASPWRNFGTSIWGQQMDETDPFFATLIKNNDSQINGELLRKEGLTRSIGKVVNDANTALLQSAGGILRPARL